ncbi:hypothetical protein Q0M94_02230 [Deinococcus radiomollis]|uniref:phage portal protein family protein n=1 Tax=Deinococcus radiomollis TaxID=468916 RepID=UPI0038921EFD
MARLDINALGASGLRTSGAFVIEEWQPQLTGLAGIRTYRQMRDNDPLIGAALFAIESLIGGVEWNAEANQTARGALRAQTEADFVNGCLADMTHTWRDHVSEALTMLTYGWAYHEIVYKYRRGRNADPMKTSAYGDGRLGWAEIPLRMQASLYGWEFEPTSGRTLGMHQWTLQRGAAYIPEEKAVHYRTGYNGGNPEGRSLFRNAYRAWYYQTMLEEIEAIGVERDLAGIPLIEVPEALLDPAAGENERALLQSFADLGARVRQDEQAYIIMPAEKSLDPTGKEVSSGYKFSLLGTTTRKTFDTNAIIQRHTSRIAMTILAEFLLLGSDSSGSWALSEDKTSLFGEAITGVLDRIADSFNAQAVQPLMRLNGVPEPYWPKLTHGSVGKKGLEVLADYIQKLVSSNVITPDDRLEAFARSSGKLPDMDPQTARAHVAPTLDQQPADQKPAETGS